MAFLKTDHTTYGDDWTIDYSAKTITNNDSGTGNNLPSVTGNYDRVGTTLNWFKWLALTFATTAQMDDAYPIQSDTPTVFKFTNGWTFGHSDDYKYLSGGSVEDTANNHLWSNVYSIGQQTKGTLIYPVWNDTVQTPWWISSDGTTDGNIDILIPVKISNTWISAPNPSGTPVDGGLWMYAREFGDLYDHNFVDLSGGGRTPIGINTSIDGNNDSSEIYVTVASGTNFTVGNFAKDSVNGGVGKIRTVSGNDIYLDAVRGTIDTAGTPNLVEYLEREAVTAGDATSAISAVTDVVAGYDGNFTETYGSTTKDLNNGDGLQPYEVDITGTNNTTKEFYEWTKYLTKSGSTTLVNGDEGQEFRSLNEGVFSEVKVAPFGTLAGTTFYGAQGVWISGYNLADFVLIDSDGDQQSPPNYQKVEISHEDLFGDVSTDGAVKIYVTEITGSGGDIVVPYSVNGTATTTGTTLVINELIDANKTPQSGIVRVNDDATNYRYQYTGFSGNDFTGITALDGAPAVDTLANATPVYTPLLDLVATGTSEASDNLIYSGTPFDVRTSVRRYGTKPYDVDTQFGSSGLSFSPILTDDPQAT
jgi:hypothetical protein